jgi:hypothetical protein
MSQIFSPATRVLPRVGESVLRGCAALIVVSLVSLPGILAYEFYLSPSFGYPAGFSILGIIGVSAFVAAKVGDFIRMSESEREEIEAESGTPVNALLGVLFYSTAMALGGVAAVFLAPYLPAWGLLVVGVFYPFADLWVGNKIASPASILVLAFFLAVYISYQGLKFLIDAQRLLAGALRRVPDAPQNTGVRVLLNANPVMKIRRRQGPR